MSGLPPRKFKHLTYLGRLMDKKMSKKSQYYVDLSLPYVPEFQSQLGEEYMLAKLGDLGELLDRLQNYDKIDAPLNLAVAKIAFDHFFDRITSLEFCDYESAYSVMPDDKAIGMGAKDIGIYDRKDPLMFPYLVDFAESAKLTINHVIINASQKDEVRPSHKTPRLFMAFPPEHTFLAIVCCNDFLRQFIANSFCKTGMVSAIGDAMQNGAAAFYRDKLKQRPFLYCTDTKAQDSSVTPEFINLFYDRMKEKYSILSPEQDSMFETVRFNSIHKLINVNGHLYLVPRGLGSGDYFTSVINVIWRLYMVLENYNQDRLPTFFEDNTVIINGDDLIMSSEYDDLDLNSKYATIEWAGKPVSWDVADFCSLKFGPNIHHDANKVLAVLNFRIPKHMMLSPGLQLQRLGGILRCHVDQDIYTEIRQRMWTLAKNYGLESMFYDLVCDYWTIYWSYNSYWGA